MGYGAFTYTYYFERLRMSTAESNRSLLVLLFTVLLTGIFIGGCSSKESPRYVNKDKKFSMQFPEKWERQEDYLGTAVIALRPGEGANDKFRENVNVVMETVPANLDVDHYLMISKRNMGKFLTNFQQVDSGQTTIDKHDTKWMVYTHHLGHLDLKVLAYTLLRDDRAYTIRCSSTPEQFTAYRSKFEEIAGTFRFE